MDKKTAGGAAGLVAAIMYGGSLVLSQESRIVALEEIHPELFAEALEGEAEPEMDPEPEEGAEEAPEGDMSDEEQIDEEESAAESQPLIGAEEE